MNAKIILAGLVLFAKILLDLTHANVLKGQYQTPIPKLNVTKLLLAKAILIVLAIPSAMARKDVCVQNLTLATIADVSV